MIRKARKEEVGVLAELVYIIIQDMELPVTQKFSANELIQLMTEAMTKDAYRFSYRNGLVCEREGKVAGVCFGYKGELEPVIDRPLEEIARQKGYGELVKVFIDSETQPGEWYLDSLVTKPKFRGQGVATELLEAAPERAKEFGETVIGLNCDQQNPGAKKLYEKQGFVKVGERPLGSHRYDHMQKNLT